MRTQVTGLKAGTLSHGSPFQLGLIMINRGIYKIKNKYFEDFPDKYLRHNNDENRPCYYCLTDNNTGLAWMIPMSRRIEKYKSIIEKRKSMNKPTDSMHVAKIDTGDESVFIISDMFPVTDEYILAEYTVGGNHLRITSNVLAEAIERKAKRILSLIRKGICIHSKQPDVLKIEKELITKLSGKQIV